MGEEAPQRCGVLLRVKYDGTRFSGFARQPNARTIAGELDGAVRAVDVSASLVRGASRTDAGVHARDQAVAFDTGLDIPSRGWVLALAAQTSDEVAAVSASRVAVGYDPRAHATRKTYRYRILRSPVRDPLLRDHTFQVAEWLNHAVMLAEVKSLEGRHDFRAFRTSTDQRTETVRTIFRADLIGDASDPRLLTIEIEGDRFLHRMIRIIAGTVVDVGRGRLPPGTVLRAFDSGERGTLGITAPPGGLILWSLTLDDEGEGKWPDHMDLGAGQGA